MKHSRREGQSAFTLVELLVVIAIIGLLAGLILMGTKRAHGAKVKSRVKTEMKAIEAAIDVYHDKIGVYPPDGTNDQAIAPLFYELTGSKFTPPDIYESLYKAGERITRPDIIQAFGRQGFANSHPEDARNFFPTLKAGMSRMVDYSGTRVEVLAVPAPGTNDFPASGPGSPPPVNTWRYVSRNPVHNPRSYDLWAVVVVGGQPVTIGNWKE